MSDKEVYEGEVESIHHISSGTTYSIGDFINQDYDITSIELGGGDQPNIFLFTESDKLKQVWKVVPVDGFIITRKLKVEYKAEDDDG